MQTTKHNTTQMAWQSFAEFPGGEAEVKMLRDEKSTGARTMLIHLSAGESITPHSHVVTVQHYVLEGEYVSEGESYGAGTYRLLAGHSEVSPIHTKNGVTILMIYDPLA